MANFEYQAIDLTGPSIRLLRLLKGNSTVIECELFDAWLYPAEQVMDYTALSYTWGSEDQPCEVLVNGCIMAVTENLYLALQHLRRQDIDRVLWVDAICINQGNVHERGHQVQYMRSIYRTAERVTIWLGEATYDTDYCMDFMKRLENISHNYACNKWNASDTRWNDIWYPTFDRLSDDQMVSLFNGLKSLLRQDWFRRVWIIQEVANARVAEVVCGNKSVSARTFAMIPSFVGIISDSHCQAVLDIMPGPSRESSWWAQKRDLQTLLIKFRNSKASDPRDHIYALLGISSDACNTDFLKPNYEKPIQDVIRDTISFIFQFQKLDNPTDFDIDWILPDWTLPDFLANLNSLGNTVFEWAFMNRNDEVVKLLVCCDDIDIGSEARGKKLLWRAMRAGYLELVKLLLETGKVDANSKDDNGQTPLSLAVTKGDEMIKMLLETGKVDVNAEDSDGWTPLSWAASWGENTAIKLLLETGKVDIDSKDNSGRTPLSWATESRNDAIKLLLETGKVNVNSKDNSGQTPLLFAIEEGDQVAVKLLLETGKADINSKNPKSRLTPLSSAAEKGYEKVVKLLLETSTVDVNSKDDNGLTPLSSAARKGHEAVVKLLLETSSVDVDLKSKTGRTPLSWAAERGSEAVIKLLLETGKVDINSKDNSGQTPLSWARNWKRTEVVELLQSFST
jgi:ankyrin repeat protein